MGVKRGVFANEAGLGSAPNVAAVASVEHPIAQGVVQAFSVFLDTFVICTCTALLILLSGFYTPGFEGDGIALTQNSLAAVVGDWGRMFISVALALFVFTSIMYNYYLGESNLRFLVGNNRKVLMGYRALVLVLIFWGVDREPGHRIRLRRYHHDHARLRQPVRPGVPVQDRHAVLRRLRPPTRCGHQDPGVRFQPFRTWIWTARPGRPTRQNRTRPHRLN